MEELACALSSKFGTIRGAFLHLDNDRSGKIDAAEFRAVLQLYHFDKSAAEEIVRTLDTNGDGLIEYHEFVELLDAPR